MSAYVPMKELEPGRCFAFNGEEYLRIKAFMTIGKEPKNCVAISTGNAELVYIEPETAVEIL